MTGNKFLKNENVLSFSFISKNFRKIYSAISKNSADKKGKKNKKEKTLQSIKGLSLEIGS